MAQESRIIYNNENSCVFKPAIPCKDKSGPEKTISKIVPQSEAIDETNSYKMIKDAGIDEKYFPGSTETCIPHESARPKLTNCKNINSKLTGGKTLSQLFTEDNSNKAHGKFSLLQIPDGGTDLFDIDIENITPTFWQNATDYFSGLVSFHENGIVHHDVKPENLLYDNESGKARFTDFGLTKRRDTLYNAASHIGTVYGHYDYVDTYEAFPFFNFPPEKILYTRKYYKYTMTNRTVSQLMENDDLRDSFIWFSRNTSEPMHDRLAQFNTFITLEQEEYTSEGQSTDHFTVLINRSLDTFDVYGLGYSLLYVLKKLKVNGMYNSKKDFYDELHKLFQRMAHVSCYERPTPQEALDEYQSILRKFSSSKNLLDNKEEMLSMLDMLRREIPQEVKKVSAIVPPEEVEVSNCAGSCVIAGGTRRAPRKRKSQKKKRKTTKRRKTHRKK
jgi:serine/threonine protein kinase